MNGWRCIIDVPDSQLGQLVKDLSYEVGMNNIKINLQLDNKWKVDYYVQTSFGLWDWFK